MCSKKQTNKFTMHCSNDINTLKAKLNAAETVVIGAGAGLSTSAGFTYSGERFDKYFSDFAERFGIEDMYSGGFYPFPNSETFWAWWSRHIYYNRYIDAPKQTYNLLYDIVKDKGYFVITTNVDHLFQKVGFDKNRLFYTQGDYGLFQCSLPCHNKTYDNEKYIKEMIKEQKNMQIPTELIPRCPKCSREMTMNLRSDDTFVEDEGWQRAAERYKDFIKRCEGKNVLFLELGVGNNTPGIIKYPFWSMTFKNENAVYACINFGQAQCPKDIEERSICIDGDIDSILQKLKKFS